MQLMVFFKEGVVYKRIFGTSY